MYAQALVSTARGARGAIANSCHGYINKSSLGSGRERLFMSTLVLLIDRFVPPTDSVQHNIKSLHDLFYSKKVDGYQLGMDVSRVDRS